MTAIQRLIILLLAIFDALMDALTLRAWSSTRGSQIIPFKVTKTE